MTVKNPETKISLHYSKRKSFTCARLRLLNLVDITDALAQAGAHGLLAHVRPYQNIKIGKRLC